MRDTSSTRLDHEDKSLSRFKFARRSPGSGTVFSEVITNVRY